jgi:hypothetical protein
LWHFGLRPETMTRRIQNHAGAKQTLEGYGYAPSNSLCIIEEVGAQFCPGMQLGYLYSDSRFVNRYYQVAIVPSSTPYTRTDTKVKQLISQRSFDSDTNRRYQLRANNPLITLTFAE